MRTGLLFAFTMLAAVSVPLVAQSGGPGPSAVMAAQREAMGALAWMDGLWRGSAWTVAPPTGEKHTVTHTERVGPFLDGSIKVIEGRSYNPDGTVGFNAFGAISYSPATRTYTLHSYAQGNSGDFVLTPAPEGYSWEISAGQARIRYTATFKDGVWREVGDRILPGREPQRFFEMTLRRIGATDWPAAGAVPPK